MVSVAEADNPFPMCITIDEDDVRKNFSSLSLASDRLKWRKAIRPVTQQTGFQPTPNMEMKRPASN